MSKNPKFRFSHTSYPPSFCQCVEFISRTFHLVLLQSQANLSPSCEAIETYELRNLEKNIGLELVLWLVFDFFLCENRDFFVILAPPGSLIINIHITTIRCYPAAVLTLLLLLSDDSWVFFWLFWMQDCRSTLVLVCHSRISQGLPHSVSHFLTAGSRDDVVALPPALAYFPVRPGLLGAFQVPQGPPLPFCTLT